MTTTPDDDPKAATAASSDVAGLSYEQARAELRQIVAALESGGQPLEESLALWQRGESLAATCQQWLEGARARLDAAIAENGEPSA